MWTLFRQPFLQRGFRTVTVIALCTLSLVLAFQRSPATAQSPISRAEITQILDGSAVFIQNKLAKVNDTANKGQRVRTAEARAQLQFNTGAVGRLAPNSVLTVGQCARLQKGTLLINGAMNGCTSSVVAGVRGTTYLMEVSEDGEANIKVLEGEVTVTRSMMPATEEEAPAASAKHLKPPGIAPVSTPKPRLLKSQNPPAGEPQPVVLKDGEKVSISPTGVPGAIEKIAQEEFTELLKGSLFNGFTLQLPGISKIQASFQRLFPNVPFPIHIPGINIPGIPIRIPFL